MKPDNSLVEHSFIVVNKGNASFNMNDVHVVMPYTFPYMEGYY